MTDLTAGPSTEPRAGGGTARPDAALADVVARLRRAMRRAARSADPDNPLAVAQLELLSCVAENPGARPGEVARLLRLAPNSVTTLVRGLLQRRLITRASGGTDRRTVALRLTADGAHAVARWQATNTAILRQALAGMSRQRQDLITAALPALRELVEAVDASADPVDDPGGGT
ncbi:MarR family transcriptional regulator [Isoptericola sp. b441]|uniref:MarR family transcriptional regulator n=1 Tax=Actinotalea lenta TaxID=3064654 RepID=A0ABT9DA58_9CELL|nr:MULTISPECIES: MarR family transcriptional regulator [unclassified Isoptericola]MDO8105837.1 MarR family transcriptional regulator [Isoptericola sp. b441]MDO8122542.1 MarR family transcriptional regulator [Isoptericola sp. b490]